MGKWADYPLGVDVSHYNVSADLGVMAQHGISFAMAKCSDGHLMKSGGAWNEPADHVDDKFSTFVQQAYDSGIPIGAYHFFRGDVSQAGTPEEDLQFRSLKAALKNKIPGKSYHFLALDLEVEDNTNTNMKALVETFYDWMLKDADMSKVPILFYTSIGWLNKFPAVRDWLSPYGTSKEMWMAQWIHNATPRTTTTWDELRSKYLPSDTAKPLTPGFANWRFWQWDVCYTNMEGTGGHEIDLNFFNGTKESLYAWLKFTPGQPQPQPEPEPESEPEPEDPEEEEPETNETLAKLARSIDAFCEEWQK